MVEEGDLEGALGDRPRTPDELVQPWFGDRAWPCASMSTRARCRVAARRGVQPSLTLLQRLTACYAIDVDDLFGGPSASAGPQVM
jgi:hypothetical protein